MGILEWISRGFGRRLQGKAVDPSNFDVLLKYARQREGSIFRTYDALDKEEVYAKSAVVYSCMRWITDSYPDAPLFLGTETDEGGFEVEEAHPLAHLLTRPNEDMAWSAYVANVLNSLYLTGVSNSVKIRDRVGVIREVWPIPTSQVTQKVDRKTGKVVSYEIYSGTPLAQQVAPRNMTRVWFPDPKAFGSPLGPLDAAIRSHQIDDEREEFVGEMLKNAVVTSAIVTSARAIPEPQRELIQRAIRDRIGRGHRGNPMFVSGQDADIKFPTPLEDLDWPGLTAMTETRICGCFRVNPILIGLKSGTDRATRSNMNEARAIFYASTMVSVWQMLQDALTRDWILNEEFEDHDLRLRHDLSEVKQMVELLGENASIARGLWVTGIATRNEVRRMVGLPPFEEALGNVVVVHSRFGTEPVDGGQPARSQPAEPQIPPNRIERGEVGASLVTAPVTIQPHRGQFIRKRLNGKSDGQ